MDRTEYDIKCGNCVWFDPAYDTCYFHGAAKVNDPVCDNFHSDTQKELIAYQRE